MSQIVPFPSNQLDALISHHHALLAEDSLPPSQRSSRAKNYGRGIQDFMAYMVDTESPYPTKTTIEAWRDDMLAGRVLASTGKRYALRTINVKLASVRQLLHAIADDVPDFQMKTVLRDWAKAKDAKAIIQQDRIERDYGLRLTLAELRQYIEGIPTNHIKGLRDRALVAVMAATGLRVTEAVSLTARDLFQTWNDKGQRGVYVRRGKHGKSRVVVLNKWDSWALAYAQAYIDQVGLEPQLSPDHAVFYRAMWNPRSKRYSHVDTPLSARGAQRLIGAYAAQHDGQPVKLAAHDLRRTYAKLCRDTGMPWEALRENLGHSSLQVTEAYVGMEVDWQERQPGWSI